MAGRKTKGGMPKDPGARGRNTSKTGGPTTKGANSGGKSNPGTKSGRGRRR